METTLGIVALIAFLILVVKVGISKDKNIDGSVTKFLYDTIQIDNSIERFQKVNTSMPVNSQEQFQKVNVSMPVNDNPVDDLISSPYYNKYKTTFDYIRHYAMQPKYRVEWLLKSLDMGHELEYNGVFVTQSIENNFPYFCETEEEYNCLTKDDFLALKGSTTAIFGLGYLYHESNIQHFLQEKRTYWRNQLIEMAKGGNLEARAGLCRKNLLFTEQEVEEYREKYETELLRMAEDGNPYAQLAVGQFIARNRKEKIEWLNKAGEQGVGDAYHYLAATYTQMKFWDDEFNYRGISLDEKEVQAIDNKIGESYLKGAKLNKGMTAAECQYNLATAYRYGYYGFEKDLVHARYWYDIAFKNGKAYAGTCIEEIDKYGE